jgi:predicted TIM-barrel fold metal-dependent hydrolase
MIIDCHVHLYPAEANADPAGWAAARAERRWAAMVGPRSDGVPSLQGWVDEERLLRDMDVAGVDRAVLLGWYWEKPATCAEQNRFFAEVVRRHPDRLEAFAAMHAAAGAEGVRAELSRCHEEGLSGLGELCPPAQGFGYDDPVLAVALELAAQWRWPVNLHVTEPAGRAYPGRVETPFMELLALAGRYPSVRFVFAHLGGLLPFFELNRAVARPLANVWYDTAASPLLYRPEVFPLVARTVGAERILYGSDYPLRLYPKAQAEPDFGRFLAEIRASGLEEAQLAAVLGGNWQRLRATSAPRD